LATRVPGSRLTASHFLGPHHNHAACARAALETAERICESNNARFTDVRRTVLTAIWQSHKPITAYELLAQLNKDGGRNAPAIVYRALDFLAAQGLIHRLTSLNAFIGCVHPENAHDAKFLICRSCRSVAELDSPPVDDALQKFIKNTGFDIDHKVVEITGLCRFCLEAEKSKGARKPTKRSKRSNLTA